MTHESNCIIWKYWIYLIMLNIIITYLFLFKNISADKMFYLIIISISQFKIACILNIFAYKYKNLHFTTVYIYSF